MKMISRLLSRDGRLVAGFSHDVCDAFWPHLRGVLTSRRDLEVIAGSEHFSLVVTDGGNLAAQHHYQHQQMTIVHRLN